MNKENVGQGLGIAVIVVGLILSGIGLVSIFSELADARTAAATPDALLMAEAPAAGQKTADAALVVAPNSVASSAEKARGELQQLLQHWRQAWASQDTNSYLAYYAPDFQGKADSPEQWRANRKRIISQAQFIKITLGQPDIKLENDGLATLSFTLDYASDHLQDHGTKTLQLRRNNGRWVIADEMFTAN